MREYQIKDSHVRLSELQIIQRDLLQSKETPWGVVFETKCWADEEKHRALYIATNSKVNRVDNEHSEDEDDDIDVTEISRHEAPIEAEFVDVEEPIIPDIVELDNIIITNVQGQVQTEIETDKGVLEVTNTTIKPEVEDIVIGNLNGDQKMNQSPDETAKPTGISDVNIKQESIGHLQEHVLGTNENRQDDIIDDQDSDYVPDELEQEQSSDESSSEVFRDISEQEQKRKHPEGNVQTRNKRAKTSPRSREDIHKTDKEITPKIPARPIASSAV